MKREVLVLLLAAGVLLFNPLNAQALVVINEILADPPSGLAGDANNDGITSSSRDEFIELFNQSGQAMDISGWCIADALKSRHTFAVDTIMEPYGALVIFGGGASDLPDIHWAVASSGTLGLNNSGETVSLFNTQDLLMDEVAYGAEGGKDQSLVRSPEGYGDTFIKHLDLENADGKRFSAGYFINKLPIHDAQKPDGPNPKVPEMATIWYMLIGVAAIAFKREGQASHSF